MVRQATAPPDSRGTPPVRSSVAGRIRRELEYYRALLGDPRTPRSARWLIGSGVAYMLLPFDLLPDFLPFVGKLDDILISSALIGLGMRLLPQQVKDDVRYRTRTLYFGSDRRQKTPQSIDYKALPAPFGVRIRTHEIAAETFGPIGMLSLELAFRHRLVVFGDAPQLVDHFDDHRLESREAHDSGRCSVQTHVDIGYRPLPLVAAISYCMSAADSTRSFCDLESAFEALPPELAREVSRLRLRRRLSPTMSIEAVIDSGEAAANDHAHRVTGSQFLGLVLNPDNEAVGWSQQKVERLRHDVYDFVDQSEFRYLHEPEQGRIIAWDPRRVQQLASGTTVDAQRYVYPERLFERVLR